MKAVIEFILFFIGSLMRMAVVFGSFGFIIFFTCPLLWALGTKRPWAKASDFFDSIVFNHTGNDRINNRY